MYKQMNNLDDDDEHYDRAEVPGVSDRDSGDSTPSALQDVLLRDQLARTAYYDHAAEKSISNAEAKLIYQRHRMDQEEQTPVDERNSFNGWPTASDKDHDGLSRTTSMISGQSGGAYRTAPASCTMSPRAENDSVKMRHPTANGTGIQDSQYAPKVTDNYNLMNSQDRMVLPHEIEHLPLQSHVIDGPGAGIRVGTGAGGFARNDANVTSELSAIYTNIQKILDLRHKYIRLSLQELGDNPKDDPSWKIYPPPPEPVWDDEKDPPYTAQSGSNSLSNSRVLPPEPGTPRSRQQWSTSSLGDDQPTSPTTTRKRRKAGQEIGEDFMFEDLLPLPGEVEMTFKLDANGVHQVYEIPRSAELETPIVAIPTIRDFYMDLDAILTISSDGPTKSFAFRRLQYLEGKFNLYFLLNEYQEMADTKRVPHRDFYNVRKVDTHVHHSSCMNQKHLLRFIKSKMKKSPDEVVIFRDGKYLTLKEVFESINLTAYDLSIDTLDMHVSDMCLHLV